MDANMKITRTFAIGYEFILKTTSWTKNGNESFNILSFTLNLRIYIGVNLS